MPNIALLLFKREHKPSQDLIASLRAALELLLTGDGGSNGPGPEPTSRGHVPTSQAADGRIQAPEGTVPQAVSDAIKRYWPENVWTDAARVSYYESAHWNATAERNTLDRAGGRCGVLLGHLANGLAYYSEQSVGLFQINVCSHGGDRAYWQDPDNNARKGAELYRANGWSPWTYTANQLGLLGG